MSLKSQIESLLFITTRPLSIKKIMEITNSEKEDLQTALEKLMAEYNQKDRGINLQKINDTYQMVTTADNSKLISEFIKEEVTGELTQASLETLTVIAYRGPITKAELEMIRGVNCSIILRNLLMRGFIDEQEDKKNLVTTYQISFDFMRHLGITEPKDLPDFEKLNNNEALNKLLNPQAEQIEQLEQK